MQIAYEYGVHILIEEHFLLVSEDSPFQVFLSIANILYVCK
jgi:hypothetical protein